MLIEPAAVAWHACRVGGVGAGSRVAVVGDGAIWLAHGGLGEVDGRTRGEPGGVLPGTSSRSENGWMRRQPRAPTTSCSTRPEPAARYSEPSTWPDHPPPVTPEPLPWCRFSASDVGAVV